MLNTERNTVSMSRKVRHAAFEANLGHIGDIQTDFEHGQWWITNRRTGAQWSVCDTDKGFDFENVTRGEDE